MKVMHRQRFAGSTAVLALIVLVILFAAPVKVLTVSDKENKPIIILPVADGHTFSLKYTHSVQKTPVQEDYLLAPEGKIILTSTTFQSLGVGTPFLPEEGTLVNQDGYYQLTGINRSFNELCLGIVPLNNYTLAYNGKVYHLADYTKPNSIVTIQVRDYTPIKIIWLKFFAGGIGLD